MLKKIFVYIQYLLPQHLISILLGQVANSPCVCLKNKIIHYFIKAYGINMQEAVIENPLDYPSFNEFFIRKLKPELRPITPHTNELACPADGCIAQIGQINKDRLLQAKGQYFDLLNLFANENKLAQQFENGNFATIYLAPNNYHRVHMPFDGKLVQTIFVPGKLFSVNRMTSALVPNLYCRNERFIAIFETAHGLAALVFVGAMIVGSMQMAWMSQAIKSKTIIKQSFDLPLSFNKGDELGYFKLGSTVLLLTAPGQAQWCPELSPDQTVIMGQTLGKWSN